MTLTRQRRIAALAFAVVLAAGSLLPRTSRADEPGVLSKDRWGKLSEVEFAELKGAEDLFRKQTYKAARNAYEKFVASHKTSDVVSYCQLMAAECTRLGEKPQDAVSDFQFVIDIAPDSDDAKWARFRIAQCYRASGDVEKALASLAEVWKENETHPTAFYAALTQVAIYDGQKKYNERFQTLEAFVERFDKKRYNHDEFRNAAWTLAKDRLYRANVDGAYTLLQTTMRKGEAESRLIEWGSEVVRNLAADKSAKDRREGLANALVAKGSGWLKEDKNRPDYQDLARALVSVMVEVNAADAVKQALDMRKLYDDAPWTFHLTSWTYSRIGKPDLAIAQAAEARRIHKDADWALDLYGDLSYNNKDSEGALAAWDMMKDKRASLTKTSDLLWRDGKGNPAIERRRKIAELFPKDATSVHMWVGERLAWAGRFPEAIKDYREANAEPTNLFRIAECLSAQKKHKEAIGQYDEIGAAFETERPRAVYCVAMEYEKLGEKDRAIKLLRGICRQYPKASAASDAHVRLQSKYGIDETLGGASNEDKDK